MELGGVECVGEGATLIAGELVGGGGGIDRCLLADGAGEALWEVFLEEGERGALVEVEECLVDRFEGLAREPACDEFG